MLTAGAAGAELGVLNVTLQLTTTDLLPVSAAVQAASKVWVSHFCVTVPSVMYDSPVCHVTGHCAIIATVHHQPVCCMLFAPC